MSKQTAIKICGISTPEIAQQAAQLGADFIGIVLHPASPRHVSIETARAIAQAARAGGAQPVAVVVEQSIADIIEVCAITGINIVQCHSPSLVAQHLELPPHLQRILVFSCDTSGNLLDAYRERLTTFDRQRDFILFDSIQPGTGTASAMPNDLHAFQGCRYFIAGGINAQNINAIITAYHPYGIDVSSSVESHRGVKDIHLIQSLLQAVANGVSYASNK